MLWQRPQHCSGFSYSYLYLPLLLALPFEMSSQVNFYPLFIYLPFYSISGSPTRRGFQGTWHDVLAAYLNQLTTAYQEKFGSIHLLRESSAPESPASRHNGPRSQRYKVALIGTR